MLKLMPEEVEALRQNMVQCMNLMAEMYHTGELDNQNSGRLNGVRVRMTYMANLLKVNIGEQALSKRI